jgi:hypothetical protein
VAKGDWLSQQWNFFFYGPNECQICTAPGKPMKEGSVRAPLPGVGVLTKIMINKHEFPKSFEVGKHIAHLDRSLFSLNVTLLIPMSHTKKKYPPVRPWNLSVRHWLVLVDLVVRSKANSRGFSNSG